jgi:hypothetical protein
MEYEFMLLVFNTRLSLFDGIQGNQLTAVVHGSEGVS